MKHKIILCLKIVLGVLVLPMTAARAQPGGGATFRSLEARILQAPVVFRATLTNVRETVTHTNGDHGPYNSFGYLVAFRVDEVLKGKMPDKMVQFEIDHVARWEDLSKWADGHVSFLWFWNDAATDLGEDFHGNFSERVVILGPTPPGSPDVARSDSFGLLFDMDLTILTKPEDIVSRARDFAKKGIVTTNCHSIYLREYSSEDHFFSRSFLVVPVMPALEKTATRLISAPEHFMTTGNKAIPASEWRCDLRAAGAEALQYFKSAKNIKLLKSLLDSPDFWAIKDWSVENRGRDATNKIYSVRNAAYEVLRGWGVDVPKPITSEIVRALDRK